MYIKKVLYICISLTIKKNNMNSTDKFLHIKNELQSSSNNLETFNKLTELTTAFFEVRHEQFIKGLDAAKEIYSK